jgi:hypothetical protein
MVPHLHVCGAFVVNMFSCHVDQAISLENFMTLNSMTPRHNFWLGKVIQRENFMRWERNFCLHNYLILSLSKYAMKLCTEIDLRYLCHRSCFICMKLLSHMMKIILLSYHKYIDKSEKMMIWQMTCKLILIKFFTKLPLKLTYNANTTSL